VTGKKIWRKTKV